MDKGEQQKSRTVEREIVRLFVWERDIYDGEEKCKQARMHKMDKAERSFDDYPQWQHHPKMK